MNDETNEEIVVLSNKELLRKISRPFLDIVVVMSIAMFVILWLTGSL